MSAAAIKANPPASASNVAVNPWVIALLVALASFM